MDAIINLWDWLGLAEERRGEGDEVVQSGGIIVARMARGDDVEQSQPEERGTELEWKKRQAMPIEKGKPGEEAGFDQGHSVPHALLFQSTASSFP
jgi:hypothetical protein